ncbi:MAG: ABC transporter ATP-binding protein [Planctomycetaceae bacterium]|nr:ABC transporter ATP-binding protein [Planctomycetaceae bacterium]
MTAADPPVVVIERLTKRFGEFTALNDLSLTIDAGQILGLIGPNGAGKSTAIRILVGLSRPTSGTARIAGADCVRDARRIKHLVGYMPDQFGSYDNMRVHEYLDFFGAAFGIRPRKRIERIREVMELTGTAGMRDKYVESLSHGMAQRVGIARTLIHDPQVLILDEPANGLDPQARIEMRDLLLKLAAMGKTLLVTSHILPELARICQRIAIITHGTLRAYGTVEEIGRQVSRQRTIEVQLLDAAQVARTAAAVRGAVEPEAEVIEAATEASVRFRSVISDGGLAELLEQLVRDGIRIAQYRELQTDLEEAFMTFARPGATASPVAVTAGK